MPKSEPGYLSSKILKVIAIAVVALGIALRVAVYLQNRDISMDEANVARNLFERDFAGLLKPLFYEQFAPPVFLWIEKAVASVGGYSDLALRFYALVCGILSLWLFYLLLKKLFPLQIALYPLAIFSTGLIYIRYASELKQYTSDMMASLILLLLALSLRPSGNNKRFMLIWLIAGSVAIWLSMPAVFIMTGVFSYYLYTSVADKDWASVKVSVITGCILVLQFVGFYFLSLQYSIHSNYLQWWHDKFFLFPVPGDKGEWRHNWRAIKWLYSDLTGEWYWALVLNISCVLLGSLVLLFKDRAKAILFLLPLTIALLAAAMRQYTLLSRVMLFASPLILVIIAFGLMSITNTKRTVFNVLVTAFACICVFKFSKISLFTEPLVVDKIRGVIQSLSTSGVSNEQLYVDNFAAPYFKYYTEIHPGKKRWASISNPRYFHDTDNFDSLVLTTSGRSAMLFGYTYGEGFEKYRATVSRHHRILFTFAQKDAKAIVFDDARK